MSNEVKQIQIFDPSLVRARRARASKHLHCADFLLARTALEIGERLLEVNRTFRRLLDLGSSQGALIRAFASDPAFQPLLNDLEFAVSSDVTKTMLAEPAQRPGAKRMKVVCQEDAVPFAGACFDLILSPLVLHHVNDLPGALVQLRQCLRPDGLFIGAFFGGETLTELRQCLTEAEMEVEHGASPHVAPFAAVRDVGSLLQRTGFALPVVDADKVTVWYDNIFKLISDLRHMGQTNVLSERRKTPMRRATFLRAAELYQEGFSREDGKIQATFEIVYATGWAPHESQQQPLRPGSAKTRMADAIAASAKRNPTK